VPEFAASLSINAVAAVVSMMRKPVGDASASVAPGYGERLKPSRSITATTSRAIARVE
jgi:hypothetical protein